MPAIAPGARDDDASTSGDADGVDSERGVSLAEMTGGGEGVEDGVLVALGVELGTASRTMKKLLLQNPPPLFSCAVPRAFTMRNT